MAILVTGGAGYIGSHTVKYLQEKNEEVIVVDNLNTGHIQSVNVEYFYQVDLRNKDKMDEIFKKHEISGVIHFAANSLVGESMTDPSIYYNNNVYGMICLLDVMKDNNIKNIVFSSTAATYGEPVNIPIKETDPTKPTNAYGQTKLAMEEMMKWYNHAYGINYVSLRYFNACGADKSGNIGENHTTETHLIPIILQVLLGKREKISVFGNDYDTKDGSAIRDYIHVLDLANAHYLAYRYLSDGGSSDIFNLGTGDGFSVLEIINSTEKATDLKVNYEISPRRAGDPAKLIASNEKAKEILGWVPKHSSIEEIISDAWKWHKSHPDGYKN
ncbi:MAG: UDP-glucose 4-epimerase GalE [Tissierellia bacterium]|nr:UDP-glucose 4-epimerase GalE [Tissierellia bacterium]